ncbi:hypothetical protein B0J13DRAFT_590953 [Dactylonectria estremocensis]|uniref:Uncharacterized protein n=1 Tax=Dactylonectria estremocensis TaxID=1079267 RepID=A0A9P9I8B5_9HYPO|nr:hypothetical protein B0J13DRAFT_590953 [Dactylonectria estremocensis]
MEGLPEGYSVFEPQWEVETSVGGPIVILNGIIEQVYAQLLDINPHYDMEFGISEDIDFEKCTDFLKAKTSCWDMNMRYVANRGSILNGPGNCRRVSCLYRSAIWWCNNSKKVKTLSVFRSIADGAQRVVNKCSYGAKTLGKVDYLIDWAVVVNYVNC